MARAMMAAAEEEKAAGIRRDMLLKLYARVLEAPGMSLRDTFATILDTLYKVRSRGPGDGMQVKAAELIGDDDGDGLAL